MRTDTDIAEHMLESGGIAVVPGAGFGFSPYFRLCFAYADAVMEEACERLARAAGGLIA